MSTVPVRLVDAEPPRDDIAASAGPARTPRLPSLTWKEPASLTPIRFALAYLYFHFGFLKFFPDLSSAEMIATQTIVRLRLGVGLDAALATLAVFEVGLALLLVLRVRMAVVFPIFLAHMIGAMSPLLLLPELTFKFAPFAPTFEGQYLLKDAVLIAGAWALFRAERAEGGAP